MVHSAGVPCLSTLPLVYWINWISSTVALRHDWLDNRIEFGWMEWFHSFSNYSQLTVTKTPAQVKCEMSDLLWVIPLGITKANFYFSLTHLHTSANLTEMGSRSITYDSTTSFPCISEEYYAHTVWAMCRDSMIEYCTVHELCSETSQMHGPKFPLLL